MTRRSTYAFFESYFALTVTVVFGPVYSETVISVPGALTSTR